MSHWPFDRPPEAQAVTTVGVAEDKLAITLVVHYEEENIWGFFCGTTSKEEDSRVVSMQEVVAKDATLIDIAHLAPGQRAWRANKESPWHIE